MQINSIRKALWVAVGACVAPVLLAACPPSSFAGTPTTAASRGKVSEETSRLLEQVQVDAYKVQNDADQLHSCMMEPDLYDWQLDGYYLDQARYRVNAMDAMLNQLRENRGKESIVQRKAINRIAPTLVNLTDTTQLAITSLNRNQSHLYASQLKAYAKDMYTQAKLIGSSVGDFQHYSSDQKELRQLKQKLQIKTTS